MNQIPQACAGSDPAASAQLTLASSGLPTQPAEPPRKPSYSYAQVAHEHKFSQAAVEAFWLMGESLFSNPLHDWPWGSRSQAWARRQVLQKYLTDEDVIRAAWVHQQAQRNDPNWRRKDPGMSFIAALLNERSGGNWRWHAEVAELAQQAPTQMDYAEAHFEPCTRRMLAEHHQERRRQVPIRRAGFHVVPVSAPASQGTPAA